MTETTENISNENRLAHARAQISINRYNRMPNIERYGLAEGLAEEGLALQKAALAAQRREAYNVAAARFRMAAESWQRAHSILHALGQEQASDHRFRQAEEATQAAVDCDFNDLRRVCSWMGLIPVLHEGWWRASTGYDPSTGDQIPDMDIESKLCREARGELEAYRVLARKIENHTLV